MLAPDVFRTIASRLLERAEAIGRMATTGYSFEEWMNWEAFEACKEKADWEVAPKPPYGSGGTKGSRDLADLKVAAKSGNAVVVEIALVHESTYDKWQAKLDWDTEKLSSIPKNAAERLQIIVAVSHLRPVRKEEEWVKWFEKVACFKVETDLCEAKDLASGGEVVIYGWAS